MNRSVLFHRDVTPAKAGVFRPCPDKIPAFAEMTAKGDAE